MEQTKEVAVKLAGLVTNEIHGVSQRGTSYGRFTLQDYTGTLEFSLYNEEYQRYKDLLKTGEVLYLEGMNQKGYSGDRYFFKIKEIRMLDTVSKIMTKSITLRVPLAKIDESLINSIDEISTKFEGDHDLKIIITDIEDNLNLDLIAGRKVNANYEFVDLIKELGLNYKLN